MLPAGNTDPLEVRIKEVCPMPSALDSVIDNLVDQYSTYLPTPISDIFSGSVQPLPVAIQTHARMAAIRATMS